ELLDGRPSGAPPGTRAAPEPRAAPGPRPAPEPLPLPFTDLNGPQPSTDTHAPAAPALATPAPAPGEGEGGVGVARRHLRLVAARPDRPRRHALDGRDRGGRGSARPGARRSPGDPARDRPPARARGDLPRPRA